MATFRWGAGGQIVGALGAAVFQRGRFGGVIRNRTPPVQPSSARQQTVRAAMSVAANAWFLMTQAQRDEWEIYAAGTPWLNRLGDTSYLTGMQQFSRRAVAEYVQIVSLGIPGPINISSNPPTLVGLPAIPVLGVTADVSGAIIQLDDVSLTVATGGWLLIQLRQNVKPTRNYYKGPYSQTFGVLGPITFPYVLDASATGLLTGFEIRMAARYADQYGRLSQIGYSQTTIVA